MFKKELKKLWDNIPLLFKYGFFFLLIFIFSLLFLISACSKINKIAEKYPQDNIVEEVVEKIIYEKTGLDIDLTPFSEEE
jgi:hypothetical protein